MGNTIPKQIFQTHKSVPYIQSKPSLVEAVESWKKFVPEFTYNFYTDEMCDTFMKVEMCKEFGVDIYQAYSKLPLAVMKADLWRYCIIYTYGGIYADTDAVCLCNPTVFTSYLTQLVCAPENDVHFCQWTFAAPAQSSLLKSIIMLSIHRILTMSEIKGEHIVHYLTGPALFTDGIEKYLTEYELPTFMNRTCYETYRTRNMVCFNADLFHRTMIKHLFAGQHEDGWTHERRLKLM